MLLSVLSNQANVQIVEQMSSEHLSNCHLYSLSCACQFSAKMQSCDREFIQKSHRKEYLLSVFPNFSILFITFKFSLFIKTLYSDYNEYSKKLAQQFYPCCTYHQTAFHFYIYLLSDNRIFIILIILNYSKLFLLEIW